MTEKLVRDKIPGIVKKNSHRGPKWRVADREEYRDLLIRKLAEEVKEYLISRSVEELADILEVVYHLAEEMGLSRAELENKRNLKAQKRGGFSKKIVMDFGVGSAP